MIQWGKNYTGQAIASDAFVDHFLTPCLCKIKRVIGIKDIMRVQRQFSLNVHSNVKKYTNSEFDLMKKVIKNIRR
jgi:hypothetical protein